VARIKLEKNTDHFPPLKTEFQAGIRHLVTEMIQVFLLVVFVKLFLVDLYKIPSASMTPTLIGGMVAHVDVNRDAGKDIVYLEQQQEIPYVFTWGPDRYVYDGDLNPDAIQLSHWERQGLLKNQFDRILVNKLAYWFDNPDRGDITIFKVPDKIYSRRAPIYIKRCVGKPGDMLTFDTTGRLVINGVTLDQPGFFQTQQYVSRVNRPTKGFFRLPEIEYENIDFIGYRIKSIMIPGGECYVFGDNMHGSLDSRYWGGVPQNRFKGRAFIRVWPLNQFNFLR
jgi:signal peptidase I